MDNMVGRQIGVQLQRERSSRDDQNDFVARDFHVAGRFMVTNAGQTARDVLFPVTYTEMPLFWSGGVLEDNQSLSATVWPECHVVVIGWTVEKLGINTTLYKGCRLAILTRGAADQRMWVNWHFMGTALVNPVGGMTTTDGTI